MAKRKTKAQKVKKKPQYPPSSQVITEKLTASVSSIYQYDPLYLKKDLLKTVLVSMVILSLQISIYFWLR